MKPTTKILIGSPVHHDEARFLRLLVQDLSACDLLILANFIVGDRQIDFVVVTPVFAALLELKNFSRPVSGQINGSWAVKDAIGASVPTSNPYQQALGELYALSDKMRDYAKADSAVPEPRTGNFYTSFRTFVCAYPDFPVGSTVTRGDRRVAVTAYPNVLEAIRTGCVETSWSLADWERFALKRLHLTAASLAAATDHNALMAQDELTAYHTRLRSFLTADLPPLLPTTDQSPYGAAIIEILRGGSNYLLCGPSGATKTFHLRHFADDLVSSQTEVPLLVDAKRYSGGDFWTFLRHAIAPFFRGDPTNLLSAAKQEGLRPVLIIDALNECIQSRRDDFLKGVRAFALQHDARIVISDQLDSSMLGGLAVESVRLNLPDRQQRRDIYAYHAGLPVSTDLDVFCAGFSNAYDLALAGRCHRDGPPPRSRVEIYDRYVSLSLGAAPPVLSTALLRHLAGELGDALTVVMSRERCETVSQAFLQEHGAGLGVVDAIFASRLVQVTADSFAFEHPLLLAYFRAEDLRRKTVAAAALGTQLAKPRNAELFDFILPRMHDKIDADEVLRAATSPSTLIAVTEGHFGAGAQAALIENCERYLAAGMADLKDLSARIQTVTMDDGKRRIAHVHVQGVCRWSPWDGLLGQVLPYVQSKVVQGRALELLDASERALRAAVQAAAIDDRIKPERAWQHFIDDVARYGRSPGDVLPPYRALLHALRDFRYSLATLGREVNLSVQTFRSQLVERVIDDSTPHFPLLPLLEGYGFTESSEQVSESLDMIARGLDLGIGTIRLHALNCLRNMCHLITTQFPSEIARVESMLERTDLSGTLLDSFKLEVMSCYGIIEPPVSLADAQTQMRGLVAQTEESEALVASLCETTGESREDVRVSLACRYISMIFEDVFQNVYYDAYTELSAPEKFELLALAAREKDSSFYLSWILEELLALDDPAALRTFQRAAQTVNHESPMLQDAVAAFRIAIAGCARHSPIAPEYVGNGSIFDAAWRMVSYELFLEFRRLAGMEVAPRDTRLWDALHGDARLAAGMVLFDLHRASSFAEVRKRGAVDFAIHCASEVRDLAGYCLSNRQHVKGLKRFYDEQAIVLYWIELLERFGHSEQLPLLVAFVDDSTYGKSALLAVKAIKARATRVGVA